MLKRKFINNVKRGLGSTFIELSNAVNKEEYKESLVYCITHDCTYDFIYEGSKGDYIYRLIDLYGEKSYFIDLVKETLLTIKSYSNLHEQLLDILMADYYNGNKDIKKFFEDYYSHFFYNGRWTKNKINSFNYLSIKMSILFGLEKVKDIIADWKKLNINISHHWFGFHVSQKYKKYGLVNLKSYSETGNQFNHTFEEFLELIKTKEFVYCFGCFAIEDEHKKCMDYLKTSNDSNVVEKILKNYQDMIVHCHKMIDIEILFLLIDKFDDDFNEEIYNTLAYYKDERVVSLALELANTKYYKTSIHMLMTNYTKEYKDIIVSLYKKVKFSFKSYEFLTSNVIHFMMNNKKNMPDEILYLTYYNDYCAFNREYIVKCMKKRNLLTDSIKEELYYDSDYEIRRYASRYIK